MFRFVTVSNADVEAIIEDKNGVEKKKATESIINVFSLLTAKKNI